VAEEPEGGRIVTPLDGTAAQQDRIGEALAIEGLVGFVLIGWTTAVFIADMNKVLRDEEVS
jgi:hypothetical protein